MKWMNSGGDGGGGKRLDFEGFWGDCPLFFAVFKGF
jgi:hypothetical protein